MTLRDLTVGDELPPLRIGPVERRTLAFFAGGSGDRRPVHIDLDAARALGRTDVAVPEMLPMAWLGRLLTGWAKQERIRSFSCRFEAATPVFAEPVCAGRFVSLDRGLATLDLTVTFADGAVIARGEAVIDIG